MKTSTKYFYYLNLFKLVTKWDFMQFIFRKSYFSLYFIVNGISMALVGAISSISFGFSFRHQWDIASTSYDLESILQFPLTLLTPLFQCYLHIVHKSPYISSWWISFYIPCPYSFSSAFHISFCSICLCICFSMEILK